MFEPFAIHTFEISPFSQLCIGLIRHLSQYCNDHAALRQYYQIIQTTNEVVTCCWEKVDANLKVKENVVTERGNTFDYIQPYTIRQMACTWGLLRMFLRVGNESSNLTTENTRSERLARYANYNLYVKRGCKCF